MKRWIRQAEYARRYAMTRQAVSKAVRAGRLPRRIDGKVDGSVDIRTERADETSPGLEILRHEKLRLQNELMKLNLPAERKRIGAAAVRKEFSILAAVIDELRSDFSLSELGLSVEQAERYKKAMDQAHRKIAERLP